MNGSYIGQGHFAVPIEALPDEAILWKGGAARQGTIVRVARLAAGPISLIVLYAMILGPFFLAVPSRGPKAAPRPHESSGATSSSFQGNPDRTSDGGMQHTASRAPVAFGVALIIVLTLSAAVFALAALQTRNAWYVVTSERICVQSGALTKSLSVIDIDKVLSVEVSSSVLERRFGLQSIQFIHAGGKTAGKNGLSWVTGDNYAMAFVPIDNHLVTNLLNHWLPRDNRGHV